MPFDVSGLTAHINETSNMLDVFKRSMYGNDTAPFISQIGNVKYKNALPSWEHERDVLRDGSVELTSAMFNGDLTASQDVLETKDLAYWNKFQIRDLQNYFTNHILPAGATYDPNDFNAVIGAMIGNDIAMVNNRQVENLTWNGDTASGTASLALVNGLLKGFSGLASTTTAAALTASNARTKIDALVDAAVANADVAGLLGVEGGMYLYTGHDVVRYYAQQYRTDFMTLGYNADFSKLKIDGTNVRLIGCSGLTGKSTAVLARPEILVQGSDLMGEESKVEIGMNEFNEYIWVKCRFKLGFLVKDANNASAFIHKAA